MSSPSLSITTQPNTTEKNEPTRWDRFVDSPKWGTLKKAAICVAKIVYDVAKFVFVAILATVLYVANPTLFAIGFIVGLAFHKKVREVVYKIKCICVKKPWLIPVVAVGCGVATVVAPPVPLAAAAFLYGAYVSSKICSLVPDDYYPTHALARFLLSQKKQQEDSTSGDDLNANTNPPEESQIINNEE